MFIFSPLIYRCFLIVFSSVSSAYALTLDDVKRLSLEHALGIKAQELELSAKESEKNFAGKWSNPQLNVIVGSFNSGGSEAPVREFNIAQAIPLTNKFSVKKELAETERDEQKRHLEQLKVHVMNQAILASWNFYVSYQLYSHGVERAKRISLIKKYLETRPRVSMKQQVDFSIISSSLIILEKEQDHKLHHFQNSQRELTYWLGKEINPQELEFTIPNQLELNFTPFNPDLMKEYNLAKFSLHKSLLEKKIADKNRIPDISLGFGYREEQLYPSNRQPYIMAGINVPLWDSGQNAYRTSSHRAAAAEIKLQETKKILEIEYVKQIELVKFYYQQFKRTPFNELIKLEKNIKVAEQAFKQGVIDINTFIQAENMLHEVLDMTFSSWLNLMIEQTKLAQMNMEVVSW